jgi:hypothetical protein
MLKQYQFKPLLFLGIAIFNPLVASYVIFSFGCLNSKLLAVLFLTLNAISITALYHLYQNIKSGIKARQTMLEIAFVTIHNGPLQSLDRVLRMVRSQDLSIQKLIPELEPELEKLNQELRGIYEFWQQETINQELKLYLGNNRILNLQDPLHDILYQVYIHTLERDFPCFRTIKLKIRNFEPVDESNLTLENKRGICRFLEEALCNVGKYATGVTCLKVTCSLSVGWYTLSIVDDGLGANSAKEGRGTQQFKNLARQIQGKFQRIPIYPQGTICELSWPGHFVSLS